MSKRIITYLLVIVMLCVVGCGKSEGKVTPTEDTKPVEEGTLEAATVGKDSESASVELENTSDKVENASKEEKTTDSTEIKTTTQPETTTKKKIETTTKKKNETTYQQTTTKPQGDGKTQAAPTNTPSGFVSVEISTSINASNEADKIISEIIYDGMSEYEIVKAIHDWIVINVQYDYKGLQSGDISQTVYNADGALIYKSAVCQGYAEAFQLLCAKSGVQSYIMYGEAGNDIDGWDSHAWNVVRINGEWYQIDCTWDDPLINNVVVTGSENLIYTYFLLTDEEMYYDHKLDAAYTKNEKVCNSTLFYGYAQYLTINESLNDVRHNGKVESASQLKKQAQDYMEDGAYHFKVAVPRDISNAQGIIQEGICNGLINKGVDGSVDISFAYEQLFDYAIYEVTVTVN